MNRRPAGNMGRNQRVRSGTTSAVERKSTERIVAVDAGETIAEAERLATGCLAPRAADYDATASHPVESWRDVWRAGLLAMGIPHRFGGLELDMPTYTQVVERLAAGCTNTGMTVHMHSTVTRFIDALATKKQRSSISGRLWRRGSSSAAGGASRKRGAEQPCVSPPSCPRTVVSS